MAERIEKFTTVAAAGASGAFVNHSFLNGTVTRVELYVPDGHAGLTQWSFWYGGAQLIPKTADAVIVANNRQFEWDLENAPTGNDYRSRVTNDDVYAHRFHVQLWIDELTDDVPEEFAPVLIVPFAA